MREMSTKCSVYAIFLSTHRSAQGGIWSSSCREAWISVHATWGTAGMSPRKHQQWWELNIMALIFFCKVFPRSMMLEQSEHCSIDDGDADQIMGQVSVLTWEEQSEGGDGLREGIPEHGILAVENISKRGRQRNRESSKHVVGFQRFRESSRLNSARVVGEQGMLITN